MTLPAEAAKKRPPPKNPQPQAPQPAPAAPAPPPSALAELSQHGQAMADEILGPLDHPIPSHLRNYASALREGLLDEGAKNSAANPATFQSGARFCSLLIAAADDRAAFAARLKNNAPSNASGSPITTAVRPNWADLEREFAEAARNAHDNRQETFFAKEAKLQWASRSLALHQSIDAAYSQFRAAARQPAPPSAAR